MLDKKAVKISLVDYQDPQQMALLIEQLGPMPWMIWVVVRI